MPRKFTPNEYIEHDDCVEMFLYDKEGNVTEKTFFDIKFLNEVIKYRWCSISKPKRYSKYVQTQVKGKMIYLHRFIFELTKGDIPNGYTIDHEDRDGLNNRSNNLKLANQSEQNLNQRTRKDNSEGVKDVCYSKTQKLWLTQITYNGFRKKSYSKTKEEAISKREEFEKQIREGVYFD